MFLKANGRCDASSLPCKIRPESLEKIQSLSTQGGSGFGSSNGTSVDRSDLDTRSVEYGNISRYANACCSGWTMDLLLELMKDLNFIAELYEVPDGLWGVWTVSRPVPIYRVLDTCQNRVIIRCLELNSVTSTALKYKQMQTNENK